MTPRCIRLLTISGFLVLCPPVQRTGLAEDLDWAHYLGSKSSSQYSRAKGITPANVSRLQVAWEYKTGGRDPKNRSQIQCNPLVIDGILYGTTPDLILFALDGATGDELWRWDPAADAGLAKSGVNRGLVHWHDGQQSRIIFANDRYIHAIDAATGKRIPSFGNDGSVDLKEGLGRDVEGFQLQANTPGVVFRNLLITGMRLGEGPAPAAPGHIRAYDLHSGEIVWRFNTIPQPGEFGFETWPLNAWQYIGGANVWTGFALDESRGIVFCPTGSAAFDFWGGNRIGDNLFANCLIALNAHTGERIWHYQFVHHDLWDRDLPAPPNLMTLHRDGKPVDVVAQVTKSGHVFVFDRENGTPIFPIEEIPVPQSDLEGEVASATQPIPSKPAPFSRQLFSYEEITDISAESHREILERFSKLRPHTPYAPPSMQGTIVFPGFDGGGEWGGSAATPDGTIYVNANEMPWILTMVRTTGKNDGLATAGQAIYSQVCAVCHGQDMSGNPQQNVPSLIDLKSRLKPEDTMNLLVTGRKVMPSFAFLSENQRLAVTQFIHGEKETEVSPSDPAATVDAIGTSPYSTTGYNRFLDSKNYPAVKPPWGTLNAIDLNTGEYRWKVPLGEYPELTAAGMAETGTENYGGPVVTAGGLVFIGASRDEHFRAFDSNTGRELWKFKLPAAAYSTPATYTVNGRQYVVVACGGGKIGTRSGETYVAFTLHDEIE